MIVTAAMGRGKGARKVPGDLEAGSGVAGCGWSGWAQQDLNLRPLGEHSPYDGIRPGTTDLPVWVKPYDTVRPDTTGFSAGKVPGDHERRENQ